MHLNSHVVFLVSNGYAFRNKVLPHFDDIARQSEISVFNELRGDFGSLQSQRPLVGSRNVYEMSTYHRVRFLRGLHRPFRQWRLIRRLKALAETVDGTSAVVVDGLHSALPFAAQHVFGSRAKFIYLLTVDRNFEARIQEQPTSGQQLWQLLRRVRDSVNKLSLRIAYRCALGAPLPVVCLTPSQDGQHLATVSSQYSILVANHQLAQVPSSLRQRASVVNFGLQTPALQPDIQSLLVLISEGSSSFIDYVIQEVNSVGISSVVVRPHPRATHRRSENEFCRQLRASTAAVVDVDRFSSTMDLARAAGWVICESYTSAIWEVWAGSSSISIEVFGDLEQLRPFIGGSHAAVDVLQIDGSRNSALLAQSKLSQSLGFRTPLSEALAVRIHSDPA